MAESAPGTLIFSFTGPADRRDWLVAELGELGFGAFDHQPDRLEGFIDESLWTSDLRVKLKELVSRVGCRLVDERRAAPENWNATWEAGIEPVEVGGFYVHPPWHSPRAGAVSLCIEPKMSFGTAHHETTRLILSILDGLVEPGSSVLDAGTGTGVLALAARKLGADRIVGFDIDPWSQENALENLARNQEGGISIRAGGIETVKDEPPFDLVIANINRAVLLEMLPDLVRLCAPGGRVVLSGILRPDEAQMREALAREECTCLEVIVEGEWIAVVAARA
ncbi:MAG: 50S ribosomal protein L11 methyltransferase [Rhodothermales bacterium]|nr:50S ribosomal protein L11 methyltransferase [Rhodothermales bacterium]